MSIDIKETFERNVAFIVDCIVKNSQEKNRKNKALKRFIACLIVAIEKSRNTRKRARKKLESFRYIVATICLEEVKRFQKSLRLQFPL